MPQLPRMKFQEEPCERFELEEGDHNPAALRARQLVDRLHTPAKQEVIQDQGTSPQHCSWWDFLDGGLTPGKVLQMEAEQRFWPTQSQPHCLPRTLDIAVSIWFLSEKLVAAWSHNFEEW